MLPEFDQSKGVSSIIYSDANNLYGGIIFHYPLPLVVLVEVISLGEILWTENKGDIGFLVEVDLEYPDKLHDKHADYPLVPDKEPIDLLELSVFQTSLKNTHKLTATKTNKMRQTFYLKKNYVVHYRNLNFFNNGIKITKVHQAVNFPQLKCLSSYIALDTQKRQESSTMFDQDLFKLTSNLSFGKFCESWQSFSLICQNGRGTSESNFRRQYFLDHRQKLVCDH